MKNKPIAKESVLHIFFQFSSSFLNFIFCNHPVDERIQQIRNKYYWNQF